MAGKKDLLKRAERMKIIFHTMIKNALSLKLLILMLLPATILKAQNVEVTVTGIRSEKGQIVIAVFKDSESYKTEATFLTLRFRKDVNADGVMKVRFSLDPGVYGLCLLDDEDNDGLMHYNFLGMPKEGFGFSDLYFTGFVKPKFDSFKFTIDRDQEKSINIRVRYIL